VYVLLGSGRVGAEGRPVGPGQLVVFGPGDHLTIDADAGQDGRHPDLEVLVLGGQPLREPVATYGPFVMNTRAELVRAVEDFQAGRLGVVPPGALMPHRG
ncbi:MAG: pirin family protein, partial [Actinomycetota bacterium]|nr:pirin family protein [Actinomycetota bacterium]